MSQTVSVLEQLVAFDTVSRNSNLALVDWVAGRLRASGAEVRTFKDASGRKANLIAWKGPIDRAGLVLSGHGDVVPVDGQNWSGDPFKLRRQGDRLLARGAADMKGFNASVMALLERLESAGLDRPVILALSYDEEIGCKGVPFLIEELLKSAPAPVACVVGEPTMMQIVDGHKGKAGMAVAIRGRGGHSALPQHAANAVVAAAELISYIAARAGEIERQGPFIDGFEPAWTTLNVGRIEGGAQLNIVPETCRFEFEVRALPGFDPFDEVKAVQRHAREHVLPRMHKTAEESTIEFSEILSYPGFAAPEHSMIVRVVRELTGCGGTRKVSFGTEAGVFAQAGVDVCVCGPGSIEVAHKADEFIELEQLERCDRFLDELTERMCR